jgi:anti-sigma factor RsiW
MTGRHAGDCRELIEQLSRFIDNDLAASERQAVMRHLRRCRCCDDFVASLEHTVRVCQDAGHTELPPSVRAQALARVRRLVAQEGTHASPRGAARVAPRSTRRARSK